MEKENEPDLSSEEFTSRRGRNCVAEISENMKVKNVTLLVPSSTLNIATLFQKYSANLCTTGGKWRV
jgi:hypothetical protein